MLPPLPAFPAANQTERGARVSSPAASCDLRIVFRTFVRRTQKHVAGGEDTRAPFVIFFISCPGVLQRHITDHSATLFFPGLPNRAVRRASGNANRFWKHPASV